ncbi:MAG: hypothetical protein JWP91_1976 [Fibrobacteres bacterium]|nr:hypothetical protein [Fibrobacterota bacterium]
MRIPLHSLKPGEGGNTAAGQDTGRIESLGSVPWSRTDLSNALDQFLPLFDRRPIRENQGGMRSVGLFNVWFLLNRLRPASVLESGIWKGQSTWLIEQTLPGAGIVSIDINLQIREFISGKARYSDTDFLRIDLNAFGWDGRESLAFFDDHQDVIPRLKKCQFLGIKHIILDDNYPEFSGNRHISAAAVLNDRDASGGIRFPEERRWLLGNLDAYHVCMPIFDYGEPLTMEKSRITAESLMGRFDPARHARYESYWKDMPEYRWTTYLKLK